MAVICGLVRNTVTGILYGAGKKELHNVEDRVEVSGEGSGLPSDALVWHLNLGAGIN